MPLSKYGTSFKPETLAILQAAFDAAWEKARALPDRGPDEQSVRDLIATRIVDAAIEGERDPDALIQRALQAFSNERRPGSASRDLPGQLG
jgi:hypothetical protein